MPKAIRTYTLICLVFPLCAGQAIFGQPIETLEDTLPPELLLQEVGLETNETIKSQLSSDYRDLESQRLALISEMYGQMYEISTLFTELERAVKLEALRTDYVRTRDSAKATEGGQALVTELDGRIQTIDTHLADLRSRLPTLPQRHGATGDGSERSRVAEDVRRSLEGKVQEILKKTDELSNLGAKVTELNNTSYITQTFKQQISWIFASLVGLVIIGFFIVASRDGHVRQTIFSGDAGIQFLTLFSIVIAIILFGITGVLEGKEISALIGGISGYILGRSAASDAGRFSPHVSQDEAAQSF